MARMANNCSAWRPAAAIAWQRKSDFCAKCSCSCGWQRGAKMTVKSCGSHFVTIFTLCSREACRRCRAALQHLEHSVCAPYTRWSVQIAPTDQRHWSVGAIPTDQNSLVGRDRPASRAGNRQNRRRRRPPRAYICHPNPWTPFSSGGRSLPSQALKSRRPPCFPRARCERPENWRRCRSPPALFAARVLMCTCNSAYRKILVRF